MKESMNYNRREVVAQQKRTRIAELKKRIILSCSFIALLAVAVVTAISFVNVNATVQEITLHTNITPAMKFSLEIH